MNRLLRTSGKSKPAIGFFEQALKLNPEQPQLLNGYLNALLTYAIRLFRHGKFAEAGKLFRFILEHRENSLVARLYLGCTCRPPSSTSGRATTTRHLTSSIRR